MKPVNGSGMKRAALINDLSCFGKCSLSVALPILSAYGVEAVSLPTAILSTHTGGFEGYVVRDMTDEMRAFSAHWKRMGLKFDLISTGFFSSPEQLEIAADFIHDFAEEETIVLVDPVLGDNGSLYGCFSEACVEKMRALCALADVISPNHTEACLLTGSAMDTCVETLLPLLPCPNAVITGVRRGAEIGYEARLDGERVSVYKAYVPIQLHGTGDVFASAYAAEILNGHGLVDALPRAAEFLDACIYDTAKRQPAHWYGLAFEDELKRRTHNS